MGDLISRQAAIDAIEGITSSMSVCVNSDECHGMKRMHMPSTPWTDLNADIPNTDIKVLITFADKVNRMPTIEPQKWIPCSERLPDKDQICLVCGKNGGMCVARFWTDGKTNLWTKTGTGKFVYPIAWTELPEPYKGEQE